MVRRSGLVFVSCSFKSIEKIKFLAKKQQTKNNCLGTLEMRTLIVQLWVDKLTIHTYNLAQILSTQMIFSSL